MGKRGRGGRTNRGGDRNKPAPSRDEDGWKLYAPVDMNNERFNAYYEAQGILPASEWPDFLGHLKKELPTTFRVTGSREHAEAISNIIKRTYVPEMQDVEHEGTSYGPPEQISWYPEGLAWQLSAPKRIVRKSAPFKVFQRFLVGETEVGNLSRQEAVSMIPPLLLDIEPHHICLDMCAAPGSKTAQMIESLNPHHTSSTGLLIANDSDYKRCHMLVHQTGRMPSKGLMVTNYDASAFPNIKLGNHETLQFDRILADVPCSGDGTMRKNVEIWRKWSTSDGNGLHSLQLRILLRAMDMLRPGGKMVYSTCSFNPIENEAVIAAALNSRKGFKIGNAVNAIPNLKYRPGLSKWKVASQPQGQHDSSVTFFESYEEADAKRLQDEAEKKDTWKELVKTFWPPANAAELGLEKCLRLVPHDQNTGGFFVCVLEKEAAKPSTRPSTSSAPKPAGSPPPANAASTGKRAATSPAPEELPEGKRAKPADDLVTDGDTKPAASAQAPALASATAEEAAGKAAATPGTEQPKKEKKDWSYREDPFSFVDSANEELESICNWFKMKESFARDHLLVRNDRGEPLRVIYLTNALLKRVLQNNSAQKLRIISAGVKAFVRQDSQNRTDILCKWRIPADGVAEILPHIGDGVVRDLGETGMETLRLLVEHAYPTVNLFPEAVKAWAEPAPVGNVILRFPAGEGAGGSLPLPLVLPMWKAKSSMSLLIDKREKSMLSLRTFGADIVKPPTNKDGKLSRDSNVEQVVVGEDDKAKDQAGDEEALVGDGEDVEEALANALAVSAAEEAALL